MNGSQQTIEKNSDKKATDRGFTNPLFDAVVDKKPLFDVDMESSEEKSIQETDDDAVDATFVRQFFCAVWPYRLLKMLNWLILLIIFIGACLSYSFPYMNIAYYRDQHIMFGLIWAAVSIPLLVNIVVNKQQRGAIPGNGKCAVGNFWTAFLALMDLCLYGICITLLLVGSVRNGEQAFRVHRNYWPSKLAPATTTTTPPPPPPPTYYWERMPSKEPEPVLARLRVPYYGNTWSAPSRGWRAANEDFHLIADPLISLFCALAIILNITLLVLAYKMMRRANIWSTPINNNEARQQCRSLFDMEYSRKLPFAVLNLVKWLVPFVMLIANVAITDSFWPHAVYAVTAIFLGHLMLWIFYFCKAHVRHQVKEKEEMQANVPQPRLFGVFVADVLFAVCAVILIKVHVQSDFMFWTYVCSLIFSSWLLFWRVFFDKNIRREFSKFSMELPQISIQLNVQINKRGSDGGKAAQKQVEQQPMGGNMEGNKKATGGEEAAE